MLSVLGQLGLALFPLITWETFFDTVMNSATANILQLIKANYLTNCQRCIHKMTAIPFSVVGITDWKLKPTLINFYKCWAAEQSPQAIIPRMFKAQIWLSILSNLKKNFLLSSLQAVMGGPLTTDGMPPWVTYPAYRKKNSTTFPQFNVNSLHKGMQWKHKRNKECDMTSPASDDAIP